MPLSRALALVGSATLGSRLLGFVRDMLIAAVLGTGLVADAFLVAFQFSNLVRRLLAEGALNGPFVPVYLRLKASGGTGAAQAFAGEVVGWVLLGLGGLAALVMAFPHLLTRLLAPGFQSDETSLALAADSLRLVAPYLLFAGVAAVLASILNAGSRYVGPALSTLVFNIILLMVLAGVWAMQAQETPLAALMLAATIALAGLVQCLLLVGMILRAPQGAARPRLGLSADTRQFFLAAGPGLVAFGVPALMALIGTAAASGSAGGVSWLYFSQRLVELPQGLIGSALGTVMVTHLGQDKDRSSSSLSRALTLSLALAIPAALALMVLSQPLVALLFQRGAFSVEDTVMTAQVLTALAAGLPAQALIKTLFPLYFAHGNIRTPFVIAAVMLGITGGACVALAPFWGAIGIATVLSAAAWLGAGLVLVHLHRSGLFTPDAACRYDLWRLGLAAGVMACVLAAGTSMLPSGSRLGLGALMLAGLAIYAVLINVWGIVDLARLIPRMFPPRTPKDGPHV